MYANSNDHKAGTQVSWLHSVYKILVTPAETSGQLGMFSVIAPPDSGPPRHVHLNEEEFIHLVDGRVRFWVDGHSTIQRSGDTVVVLRGQEHSFRVLGDTPARFVTCVTPGGFESFFASAAQQGLQIPRDQVALNALAAQYGCRFTGAPIGAED